MSIPIHAFHVTTEQLNAITRGELVEVLTDKDLQVLLVAAAHYDQTPGRNGAQLIPVSDTILGYLATDGHTAFTPNHSPYVFSISIQN